MSIKRPRYGGAGQGAGAIARSVAASPAVQRAVERRIRLWATKDAEGHREDREYCEKPIRTRDPDLTHPHPYSEPTSRANILSWVLSRISTGSFPTVAPLVTLPAAADGGAGTTYLAARFTASIPPTWSYTLGAPSPGGIVSVTRVARDQNRRDGLISAMNSSFIATRYGLCRIRERLLGHRIENIPNCGDSNLASNHALDPATVFCASDIVPWGASSMYPSPFQHDQLPALPVGQAYDTTYHHHPTVTSLNATPERPWCHMGSGCLPLFFMDQPNPFTAPRASVIRDNTRFGSSVRLKYRELSMTFEYFPMRSMYATTGGEWRMAGDGVTHKNVGMTGAQPRTADRVRVILFSRRKPKPGNVQPQLYPPIFPPVPSDSHFGDTTWQGDVTYDTPSQGEKVFTFPSTAVGSDFIIHEDVVMRYPKAKRRLAVDSTAAPGSVMTGATTGYRTEFVFAAAGTDTSTNGYISVGSVNASSAMPTQEATLHPADADGIPHTRQKMVFYRKFADDGKTLTWTPAVGDAEHEMAPQLPFDTHPSGVGPDGTIVKDTAEDIQIDMCDRELFVTVITGAHLECRPFVPRTEAPVNAAAIGGFRNDCGPNANQLIASNPRSTDANIGYGWRLSPQNVCNPSFVDIRTKVWYADEQFSFAPDEVYTVDASGAPTGRLRVVETGPRAPTAPSESLPLGLDFVQISSVPPAVI